MTGESQYKWNQSLPWKATKESRFLQKSWLSSFKNPFLQTPLQDEDSGFVLGGENFVPDEK